MAWGHLRTRIVLVRPEGLPLPLVCEDRSRWFGLTPGQLQLGLVKSLSKAGLSRGGGRGSLRKPSPLWAGSLRSGGGKWCLELTDPG